MKTRIERVQKIGLSYWVHDSTNSYVTNSVEKSPSWEANSCSGSQEIPPFLQGSSP
jgi:hypothetical protein